MENILLTQLSTKQLNELIERYYGGEKVSGLIKAFGLNIKPARLVGLFPPVILKNSDCKFCKESMRQRYVSRSAARWDKPEPFCEKCGHINNEKCNCDRCRAIHEKERERLESAYKKNITSVQHNNINPCDIRNLSIEQAFYLIGLCRHTRYDDSDLLAPMSLHRITELSPTMRMNKDVLKTLYLENLIDISESTEYGVIDFIYESFDFDLHWYYVEWRVNFSKKTIENINLISQLENILRDKRLWPLAWHSELHGLWSELSLHECLRYMQIQLEKYDFQLRVGEKTINVLKSSLKEYSVRQCYYFIWVSVKNSVAYYVEKNISKRQATNGVVGQIQLKVERSLAEKWNIKSYNKNEFSGASVLSAFYSHVITDLGDDFLLAKPTCCL